MLGLTSKQKRILGYINDFIEEDSIPPTVYEIGEHFDIKTSTVFAHLKALEKKKYITRSSKARSISILKRPIFSKSTKQKIRHISFVLPIPLLGRINAGAPAESNEYNEGEVYFDCSVAKNYKHEDLFALKIIGESMRDLGIYEGDIVIAAKTNTIKQSDVVVAIVDNETTIKSFYNAPNNQIELRPSNPEYPTQIYNKEIVDIQGKVIGLQRAF